jgi:hypothetical protein
MMSVPTVYVIVLVRSILSTLCADCAAVERDALTAVVGLIEERASRHGVLPAEVNTQHVPARDRWQCRVAELMLRSLLGDRDMLDMFVESLNPDTKADYNEYDSMSISQRQLIARFLAVVRRYVPAANVEPTTQYWLAATDHTSSELLSISIDEMRALIGLAFRHVRPPGNREVLVAAREHPEDELMIATLSGRDWHDVTANDLWQVRDMLSAWNITPCAFLSMLPAAICAALAPNPELQFAAIMALDPDGEAPPGLRAARLQANRFQRGVISAFLEFVAYNRLEEPAYMPTVNSALTFWHDVD